MGGLCYLNQRAADSQLAGADGIFKDCCQFLKGTRSGWERSMKQEKKENKIMMLKRLGDGG